jgi:hypothetical protein
MPVNTAARGDVQLGRVEVSRGVLGESGRDLAELLAAFEPLDLTRVGGDLSELPGKGWRVLSDRPGIQGQAGRHVSLAAPHAEDAEGWVMLSLALRDGRWLASAHPGPVHARPPKAVRREGLRLLWCEEPVIGIAGEPLCLRVGLRNVSERPWKTYDRVDENFTDHLGVVAWLYDTEGHQLPARDSFLFSWHGGRTIMSGETVMLLAEVMTTGIEELPPGEYGIRAMLTSVDLRSDPGVLQLVDRDSGVSPTYVLTEEELSAQTALPSKYYGIPGSVRKAEAWVAAMVEALGEAFDPDRSFVAYDANVHPAFAGKYAAILDQCLTATRALLGSRLEQVREQALSGAPQQASSPDAPAARVTPRSTGSGQTPARIEREHSERAEPTCRSRDSFAVGAAPEHVEDVSVGAWIPPQLGVFGSVGGLVPMSFESYLRVDPRGPPEPHGTGLARRTLTVLAHIIRRHGTTGRCFFAIWEGYGWLHPKWKTSAATEVVRAPALPDAVLAGPKLALPHRNYHLFEGPLDSVLYDRARAWLLGPHDDELNAPDLIWPEDQSWFIATDTDLWSAYVGCSSDLAQQITAEAQLEVNPVSTSDMLGDPESDQGLGE